MSCYKDGGCGIAVVFMRCILAMNAQQASRSTLKESRASRKDYRQSETCTT